MKRKTIGIIFLGNFFQDARCMNMVDSLTKSGHRVFVIDEKSSNQPDKYRRTPIYHIDTWIKGPLRYWFFYKKSMKQLKQLKFDALVAGDLYSLPIISHFTATAITVYDSREVYTKLAALSKKPMYQKFWSKIEKNNIYSVDKVLVTAQSDADSLHKTYHRLDIYTIKNFPPKRLACGDKRYLRNKLAVDETKKILLYQGVIQIGRGIKQMIDLLPKLTNTVVVTIGNGPEKEALKNYAKKKGVGNRFFPLDSVPYQELLQLTAGADIGFSIIKPLSQSYLQALPNKLFEYVLCGVPVVASNFSEMKSVIDQFSLGETVDPYDTESHIKIVGKMLENPISPYKLQATAVENFVWESQTNLFVNDILECDR